MSPTRTMRNCLEAAAHDPLPAVAAWNELADGMERMIAIQMEAFPDHWSDEEKREEAQRILFGAPASQDGLSSLRDRAPAGLVASRFNPSRENQNV